MGIAVTLSSRIRENASCPSTASATQRTNSAYAAINAKIYTQSGVRYASSAHFASASVPTMLLKPAGAHLEEAVLVLREKDTTARLTTTALPDLDLPLMREGSVSSSRCAGEGGAGCRGGHVIGSRQFQTNIGTLRWNVSKQS